MEGSDGTFGRTLLKGRHAPFYAPLPSGPMAWPGYLMAGALAVILGPEVT